MLKGKITEREGKAKKEIVYLQVHSKHGHNSWSWAGVKPGQKSYFWVSNMGAWAQGNWPSLATLPGHDQGAESKVEQLGLESVSRWDASAAA